MASENEAGKSDPAPRAGAVTNHTDSGKGPGVPQDRPAGSRAQLAMTCLSGALAAAWATVDDDLKDELRRAGIRAGMTGIDYLSATAGVWLPRGSMLARMALMAARESIAAMGRNP